MVQHPAPSRRPFVFVLTLFLGSFGVACAPAAPPTGPESAPAGPSEPAPIAPPAPAKEPIFNKAALLGRGINLGNALEAPSEGAWGVTLRDEDFTLVSEAGFEHVRVPVRWSGHALEEAPYTIDPEFFARVDWAVNSALKVKLKVIINVHHYEGIIKEPDQHTERLLGLWSQIAEHYAGFPDTLYFEPLNEANGALTAEKNNQLIARTLDVIRQKNPDRAVIVGGTEWNSFRGLPTLELPEADRNLIVTIHYYDPFDFTHQGAPWVGKQNEKGIDWPGPVGTQDDIARDFETAVQWGKAHGRPLYLGEFGVYSEAEMAARERWTKTVVRIASSHDIPMAYWELRSGFGAYDMTQRAWREPLLNALLGDRR